MDLGSQGPLQGAGVASVPPALGSRRRRGQLPRERGLLFPEGEGGGECGKGSWDSSSRCPHADGEAELGRALSQARRAVQHLPVLPAHRQSVGVPPSPCHLPVIPAVHCPCPLCSSHTDPPCPSSCWPPPVPGLCSPVPAPPAGRQSMLRHSGVLRAVYTAWIWWKAGLTGPDCTAGATRRETY